MIYQLLNVVLRSDGPAVRLVDGRSKGNRPAGWLPRAGCGISRCVECRGDPKFAVLMTDLDLSRALRVLRRTVLMLQTELRQGRIDQRLITDIDVQMERGIAGDPRCADLVKKVDALRESTLTPRAELYGDAVRACEKLNDAIEGVLSAMA